MTPQDLSGDLVARQQLGAALAAEPVSAYDVFDMTRHEVSLSNLTQSLGLLFASVALYYVGSPGTLAACTLCIGLCAYCCWKTWSGHKLHTASLTRAEARKLLTSLKDPL